MMLRWPAELRCLVCQNQTIADSHADLAVDLRNQIREMLRQGQSERQIIDYMTARYGDFVLYRPPLKVNTALLWFGPALLLVGGLATLFIVLRRRSRLGASISTPTNPKTSNRPCGPPTPPNEQRHHGAARSTAAAEEAACRGRPRPKAFEAGKAQLEREILEAVLAGAAPAAAAAPRPRGQ